MHARMTDNGTAKKQSPPGLVLSSRVHRSTCVKKIPQFHGRDFSKIFICERGALG